MATGAFSDMVLYLQNTINLILDKIGRRILEVFDGRYWSNNFIKFPDNKEAENPEWICVPNPTESLSFQMTRQMIAEEN